jgi:hypothetical protein
MKKHQKLINNVAKETELLESLEWDYEKLNELYQYLDIHFSGDSIVNPDILLSEVAKLFSKECADILQKMFLAISLSHGLFIHDPSIEN